MDEVAGMRLRSVERFACHGDDGSPSNADIGSVHLWFEDGRGMHLDTRSDWTLTWSVSEPGDDSWLEIYDYEHHGRWTRRDASTEVPFVTAIGTD